MAKDLCERCNNRMMDLVSGMRLFHHAARTGSFSAVARELGVAPSSVSRQIAELEDELGARLFHRTTRKLSLTEAGRIYRDSVERILSDIDDAHRELGALESEPRGRLRVTAPVNFARLHVAPAVPAFVSAYPKVQLELSSSDQIVDLVEDGYDLAIRIGALPDSSLVARRLAGMQRVICASPVYLQRAGVPAQPKDLSDHECLTFRVQTSVRLWRAGGGVWRLRDRGGEYEVAVTGPVVSNSADMLVSAAIGGLGLVLMPSWQMADEIDDGRLIRVLTEYEVRPSAAESAIYAVYPSARHLSSKVRVFIDYLAERYQGSSVLR